MTDIFSSTTELCEEHKNLTVRIDFLVDQLEDIFNPEERKILEQSIINAEYNLGINKGNLLGRKEVFMAWKVFIHMNVLNLVIKTETKIDKALAEIEDTLK
jgi:hypothetical protein